MKSIIRIVLLMTVMLSTSPGHAEVVLDGSMGRSGAIAGPNYSITNDLGKQLGGNLFHSFSSFNLIKNESATFSGPNTVQNIISRVTGGSRSSINGTIRSEIPNADLYLINPTGIVFGQDAKLDMSGSFHASTADYLKLSDGGRFDATIPANSLLTVAAPSAFGFLSDIPNGISVDGSFLKVPEGKTLSMIGGDQTIQNGTLHAPSGTINLVSVASVGEAIVSGDNFQTDSFSNMGKISIEDTRQVSDRPAYNFTAIKRMGNIDVSGGNSGGKIFIRGGDFNLVNGQAKADTFGSGNAQGVDIKLTDKLDMYESSFITSRPFTSGSGGDISIASPQLNLDNSYITSESCDYSTGNAGNIFINIGKLTATNYSQIITDTYGDGRGGNLEIKASESLSLGGNSFIESSAWDNGDAGSINVTAAGNLSIINGGIISSSTKASGNAGSVKVNAGSIAIDGHDSYLDTGILSNANSGSTGNAGSIDVTTTGNLSIISGGYISSSTWSSGNAGTVNVDAGSIVIDGQGSYYTTGIFSQANSGTGNAGNIDVTTAGNLSIINGGSISSSTWSSGNAGTVKVDAGSIVIDRQGSYYTTGIFSNANSDTGNAGSIDVTTAGNLSIINGGSISSSTWSSGHAGSVKVDAGSIVIDRQGSSQSTGIFSEAKSYSAGDAGSIDVTTTGNLSIISGGSISSSTSSSGNAGSIKINADNIVIDGKGIYGTGILSEAKSYSTGDAGSIDVTTTGNLSIIDGGRISSSTSSSGNAGSAKVNADNIVIDGQDCLYYTGILSDASSGSTGNAGSIDVKAAGDISIISGGSISSNTWSSGNAGSVKVNADNIVIDGQDNYVTGIFSDTNSLTGVAGIGDAGSIDVIAVGNLSIINRGYISSSTSTSGNAGSVKVNAGNIVIDGQGSGLTGIFSDANSQSTGDAGSIYVSATGNLSFVNGGRVSSSTSSSGDAGTVKVDAGSIVIDRQGSYYTTGIFSEAKSYSTGDAGSIDVTTAGNLSIISGGYISSSTWSSGNAGTVNVDAGSIVIDRQGSYYTTGIFSNANSGTGNAGSINVTATGNLSIINGGVISSSTWSSGNAGTVNVDAGSIVIDIQKSSKVTGIISDANADTGNAGSINVTATGNLSIINGGRISSITFSEGNAGTVKVNAGSIVIDRQGSNQSTGIFSEATSDSTGAAGSIDVSATGNLSIIDGGVISSDTLSSGDAGFVKVNAGSISIDGSNKNSTYIGSNSLAEVNGGNGGSVDIMADTVSLSKHGYIAAQNSSSGSGGKIELQVKHLALTEGGGISTTTWGTGNAGDIIIRGAEDIMISGVSGISWQQANGRQVTGDYSGIYLNTQGSGNGGNLQLDAKHLTINDGGMISAVGIDDRLSNLPTTKAGNININAGSIVLSGGGLIGASTSSAGAAGSVTVNADTSIAISGKFDRNIHPNITNPTVSDNSGIYSNATYVLAADENARTLGKTLGNAGNIIVKTPALILKDGGVISTGTEGAGRAGAVQIDAGTLLLDGASSSISAKATAGSSGQTGSVTVNAADSISLADGGELSIRNDAIVDNPTNLSLTLLSVSAPNITLNNAQINAATTGNAAASRILVTTEKLSIANGGSIDTSTSSAGMAGNVEIDVGRLRMEGNSSIASESTGTGNAGSVNVKAIQGIALQDSSIKTSSQQADGGSIKIGTADISLKDSSSISASVAGGDGKGGSVEISAASLGLGAGSKVESSTGGAGKGGSVTINVTDRVDIAGIGTNGNSGLFSTSSGSGAAGVINVTAPFLNLSDGGQINVSTSGSGMGGDITINTPQLSLSSKASVLSESTGTGIAGSVAIKARDAVALTDSSITTATRDADGGNIFIDPQMVRLTNSEITATVKGGTGNGGNISVVADNIVLDKSKIIANAEGGNGGNINLTSKVFLKTPESLVSASSRFGLQGNVKIGAPLVDVSGNIVDLHRPFLDANSMFPKLCAESEEDLSTFVLKGRDGLPLKPGGLLTSP